jgi:TolB-like protein/AraC-like DNA-binding protein
LINLSPFPQGDLMQESDSNSDHPARAPSDNAFVKRVEQEVASHFRNEQFSVEELAQRLHLSRSQLHRKLKQATGQSANQFIREYRLQQAAELLKKEDLTVAEIAFEVGFGSHSYFTTCFSEHFGYPPGEARRKLNEPLRPVGGLDKSDSSQPLRRNQSIRKWLWAVVLIAGSFLIFKAFQQTVVANSENSGAPGFDRSIAVLPFTNLNDDSESEYFSNGVVGAINRHLSQIGDLKVISLTSTGRYQKSGKTAREIGEELKVSNLLEGSIQRYQDIVRMEVRLIDAATERQIWAENYDRQLEDIFKTQSEIAEQVALALRASLSPEEKEVLHRKSTSNSEAYDLYLKGVYEQRTFTRGGIYRSSEYFRKAIDLDSSYALAYVGLAASYILKASIFGAEMSTREAMNLAKPLLDKALTFEPDLEEARYWNGFYLLYNNWDWEGAEKEYKKAIATKNPDALCLYADLLNFTRRPQEALTICEQLQQMEPYYPNNRMILTLYYLERYDEAIEYAQARLRLFSNYSTLENYGFLLLNIGKYDEAIEMFQRVVDIEGIRYPRVLGWMGAAYARSGQPGKARELLKELRTEVIPRNAGSPYFFMAIIQAALGEAAQALASLQKAHQFHEMEMPWLNSEPQLYTLHDEPAFQELLGKVGFR